MARVKEIKVIREISNIIDSGKSDEDAVRLIKYVVEKYYIEGGSSE